MSFYQTFEREQGFIVESDAAQIFNADACFSQTILDRSMWKLGIVLLPSEALFLRSSDNSSITDQTRSAVVIEC